MDSITEFVEENGIESFLEVIQAGKQSNKIESPAFHEVAEKYNIEEEDWFEFAWALNDILGDRGGEPFHIPTFNYRKVERVSEEFVTNNAPVLFGDICEYVENTVDMNGEPAAPYLELATMTTAGRDENGEEIITELTWD
jgi:hypothetical protein